MRIKTFTTEWHYLSNWGTSDRTNFQAYPVPKVTLKKTVQDLLAAINKNDDKVLAELLGKEFIYPQLITSYKNVRYDSFINGIGQRDTYKYEKYKVAPTLEMLIVDEREEFLKLYRATEGKPKLRARLLDFSNLDLRYANLSSINFAKANFHNCNLSYTEGLTQVKLDRSIGYDYAKLPKNLLQVWTKEKSIKVVDDLVALKTYGRRLQSSTDADGKKKGGLAVSHADYLINLILQAPKHDAKFRNKFLQELHKYDSEFDKPRYHGIKTLIANIALFILGAGVLYAAAATVNYLQNDRVLFFTATRTRNKIEQVAEDMAISHSPSA
ncbi:MAG: pentapeptide repeat-containing protein [Legionella sp.]